MNDIIRKLNYIRYLKAKRKFKNSPQIRVVLYDKIQALTGSMSLNEIVNKLLERQSKTPYSPTSVFLKHLSEGLESGSTFSESLRGWAEPSEIMVIGSGEESGKLDQALLRTIKLMEQLIEMKKRIISNMIYPIILFVALFGVIYGFANYMIPILIQFGDPQDWDTSPKMLYYFSTWISDNILLILGSCFVLSLIIKKTLGNWTKGGREIADKFPPYSIYKEIQSGMFLIALSTLMQSGFRFSQSLTKLESNATPYLADKIREVINNIEKGMDNGKALNTKFIGSIGNDIEDYASGGSGIDVAMEKLGDRSIQEKLDKITQASGAVRGIAILLVMFFIIWAYSSFITITMSIEI